MSNRELGACMVGRMFSFTTLNARKYLRLALVVTVLSAVHPSTALGTSVTTSVTEDTCVAVNDPCPEGMQERTPSAVTTSRCNILSQKQCVRTPSPSSPVTAPDPSSPAIVPAPPPAIVPAPPPAIVPPPAAAGTTPEETAAAPSRRCLTGAQLGGDAAPVICGEGSKLCLFKATITGLRAAETRSSGSSCQMGEAAYVCQSNARRCPSNSEEATANWDNYLDYTIGAGDNIILTAGGTTVHSKNGLIPCPDLSVQNRTVWAARCDRGPYHACPATPAGREASSVSCTAIRAGNRNATYAQLSGSHGDNNYRGRPVTVAGDDRDWGPEDPDGDGVVAATPHTQTTGGDQQVEVTTADATAEAAARTEAAAARERAEAEARDRAAADPATTGRHITNITGLGDSSEANGAPRDPNAPRATGNYIDERWRTASRTKECYRSKELLNEDSADCETTKNLVEGARVMEQSGQMVGSMSVNVAGTAAQSRAISEQSQTAALEGAKKLSTTTASINGVMGATSLAMSMAQFAKAGKHKRQARDLTDAIGEGTDHGFKVTATETSATITNGTGQGGRDSANIRNRLRSKGVISESAVIGDLNRNVNEQEVQDRLNNQAREALTDISGEQSGVSQRAMLGATMALNSSVRSMMQMGQNIAQAKALEKQIDALKNLPTGTVELPTLEGDADQMAAAPTNGGGAITGDGASTSAAAEGQEEIIPDDDTSTDLGGPANMGDQNGNAPGAGPVAGGFTAGAAPGGGSGGGAGGGGANGTSDAKAATEGEAGPKMAQTGKLGAGYGDGASGGGPRMGGAGGGGGGNDAIAMPDLSALLAQFQPKEGEAGLGSKNGIMDYGGRTPSSEDTGSFLDRKANIFERIGSTYRDAEQRRRVVAQ